MITLFFCFEVFAQTTPTIATASVTEGSACAGAMLPVNFTTTNLNVANRTFTVQLSSLGGNFTTTTTLATGRTSPIVVTLPAAALAGDYRLRVVTDTAGVTSTPSALFTMLRRPTAVLSGDTTINVGGTATLSIGFSGNGPWTYTFTNTNTGTASVNPFKGTVQPTSSTTYQLQSVTNICGAGTVSGSARVTVVPRINTSYAPVSVCAGATAAVPFALTGAFETTGVTYTVQLSDAAGNFTTPTSIGTGTVSPLNVTFPATLAAGSGYRVRVVASATATSVSSGSLVIKPLPSATVSGGSTVTIGESSNLVLAFTGDAPWTYRLSDGQTGMASASPVNVAVSPAVSTTYTLQSVSNACGNGTVSGSAAVVILPRLSVSDVALGSVCVGANVSLPFVQTGTFGAAVTYTAQLSDAGGSFVSPRTVGTGSGSPIAVTIPTNLAAGTGYRLRVVASANATSIGSAAFTIRVRPTATLTGNQTVNFGENATLSLTFTAESPWTFTLSDGTTATADRSPFSIAVRPIQTTNYQVVNVRNQCGEGTASGTASVTVIPRLITENFSGPVCSGKVVSVAFALGGVLPTNTTYQAQLSDANGSFNTPTNIGTGSSSPVMATMPANLASGGGYRVRVIAVGTAINSIPNAAFAIGQQPTATLSGGGTFPIRPGEEVPLVIRFTGDAPWTYTLSDNSTGTVSASPAIVTVAPMLPTTYTLKSVSNTCGAGTVSGSAVVNVLITSVNLSSTATVEVSPNPVSNVLRVRSQEVMQGCEMLDLSGKIWKKLTYSSPEYHLNVASLPSGVYLIKTLLNDRWQSTKVVKE
ncbi:MAG: T9SS type A sorting domain-containing protein [Spirosomaceae bacterium]|nr:T9SS type A sorting domain-containing protein [Spirosomataceae bacterium]